MINIQIDVTSLIEPFHLSEDDVNDLVDYTVKEITTRFASALEIEANNSLGDARLDYTSNINVVDEGFAKGAVILTGFLPNSIEQGVGPYDLKPGLLNGPSAKIGADGSRYNTIPFTWGTPGTLSENFSNTMPEEVYDIAKSKPIRIGRNTSSGITKDELPQRFQEPQSKKIVLPGSNAIVDYQHKHSIYEGIRKEKDSVTKQNRYTSFRRVSDHSDLSSFIHPGFEKKDLFGKTLINFDINKIIGEILDEIF